MSMIHTLPYTLIHHAYENHHAIGAFNAFNLETVKAGMRAAQACNTPIIIQTSEAEAAFAGIENIAALFKSMAHEMRTPVILNFDHGKKIESLERAVRAGYHSVMIDASELPFEENILKTQEVVRMAHASEVWVEAELGMVPTPDRNSKIPAQGRKNQNFDDEYFTDPAQAKGFVERTGIDALAVAIGNQHGFYKGEVKIDLERLRELKQALGIPLVLHGGSGIPDSDIKTAIGLGIAKINVNTELRIAYINQLKKSLEAGEVRKPHEIMGEVAEAVKEVVVNKIQLFQN